MSNRLAHKMYMQHLDQADELGCNATILSGAQVLDAGVESRGGLAAGLLLARLCLGDRAEVQLLPADHAATCSHQSVFVWTDDPLLACLGCQYAGWPIKTDDYFAMGSGPMRLVRGREEALEKLDLHEPAQVVTGVLESDKMPTEDAIHMIAFECGVAPQDVHLAIAPSSSIAGSLQVVARSIETSLHKLFELGFDVRSVRSATGSAPLPPPAKPGDSVQGIGRTNDAMLYGASVALWVDQDDEVIESIVGQVPSCSSGDYGSPFATVFKKYDFDFYKVDPLLFSPAVVTIHNVRTGRTFSAGKIQPEILRQSFLS